MVLSALVIVLFASGQSRDAVPNVRPKQVSGLTLHLDCHQTSARFSIANPGPEDTTLFLGHALGNGAKYMIEFLKLTVQVPGSAPDDWPYSPHGYPGVIVGRLDDWLQALPARSEFAVTARPEDFWRHGTFAKGTQLRLTLVVPEAPKEPTLVHLHNWRGTLTSNTCVVD